MPAWPATVLLGVLVAQVGLGWIHGRLLHRQHTELVALRHDVQDLAEALDYAYGDPGLEEEGLAPARRPGRRAPMPRLHLAAHRIQEGQEQDPAMRELEASRKSAEKAVKDAKTAQRKLSVEHAAERAERAEKVDKASKGFLWATIASAAILLGAFAMRGFIRKQRG
jgi:hypothetical protein